jgi:poly-gamma-glutamate synthesis protein (capsule biosynthesis protein)
MKFKAKKILIAIVPPFLLVGLFCLFIPLAGVVEREVYKNLPTHYSLYDSVEFFDEAYEIGEKLRQDTLKTVYGGIVPHHLMVRDYIGGFFLGLEKQNYQNIVLISPNHFQAGQKGIITSEARWETPYGDIYPNLDLVDNINRLDSAEIDEEPFINEHGISGLVSFIRKSFPSAKITPIILRENLSPEDSEELADLLNRNLNAKSSLVLASVDFSHYQFAGVADYHDVRSNSIIKNFDFDRVYSMEIDSPPSIYTVLKYLELKEAKQADKLYSTNSGNLIKRYDEPTTTHNFYYFLKGKGENYEEQVVSMLFLGDMMLDRYVAELINRNGLDYLFKNLTGAEKRFFKGQDIISANLEGAVTNGGEHYDPEKINDFAFNPEIVKKLKTEYNFNFFNLANNHFYDQGEQGVNETWENLDILNLNYSGCPDTYIGDCTKKIIEVSGKKIAFLGASMVQGTFDTEKLKKEILKVKKESSLVVLNIHWGVEYEHEFNNLQQKIAHEMINAGVDVIIGHHPHVVQGIEIYNNRPIFYSLGNFIFDQYFSADTQEGLVLGINYSDDILKINLFPLKSIYSQVELMNIKEKERFFQNLKKWSEGNIGEIEKGELVIKLK